MKMIQMTYCKRFDNSCYHHQCIANHANHYLQCTDGDNKSYRNKSIWNALMMVTRVIKMFAICCFYRFHWP